MIIEESWKTSNNFTSSQALFIGFRSSKTFNRSNKKSPAETGRSFTKLKLWVQETIRNRNEDKRRILLLSQ